MTTLTLVLFALSAAAPVLLVPLKRVVADPVLPVATVTATLLALTAAVAARLDPVDGWEHAAAIVLGVAAATTGGSVVVRSVFRLMRREFLPARTRAGATPPAEEDPAPPEPTDAGRPESVLRGGAWIGYLERAAVATTVLAGWPEGIALVLAVKGVGRYSELREANAPEAFIVGTLASLLWAAAAAGTAHLLR